MTPLSAIGITLSIVVVLVAVYTHNIPAAIGWFMAAIWQTIAILEPYDTTPTR